MRQAHSLGKPGFGSSGEVDSGGFQSCCGLMELCCPCACTAKWSRYGRSKLANMLFSNELQVRLTQNNLDSAVMAITAQPGYCSTQLQMHAANDGAMPCWQFLGRNGGQSAADGAMPMLMAATDPKVVGGMFVEPSQGTGIRGLPKIAKGRGNGGNARMSVRLWDASNKTTGASWPVLGKK
jgi:NAD(P)-dependent dehydrogenase (short-subunit alcohol dehydrogenase family)